MEQLIVLVELLFVAHLLLPHILQVLPKISSTISINLPGNLLLLLLGLVLSGLELNGDSKVLTVSSLFFARGLVRVNLLSVVLGLERLVDESLLVCIIAVLLKHNFAGLLRAKVGLVVLLVNHILGAAGLLGVSHLHRDKILVGLHVVLLVHVSLVHQTGFLIDTVVESVSLVLTLGFQISQFLLMALQCLHGSLVSDSDANRPPGGGRNIAEGVVVDGEGALGAEEGGDVGVVGLRDCLAVESILDKLANVTVRLTTTRVFMTQFGSRRFVGSLGLAHVVLGRELDIGRLLVGIVMALEDGVGVELTVGMQESVLGSSFGGGLKLFGHLFIGGLVFGSYFHTAEADILSATGTLDIGGDTTHVVEHFLRVAASLHNRCLLNDSVVFVRRLGLIFVVTSPAGHLNLVAKEAVKSIISFSISGSTIQSSTS